MNSSLNDNLFGEPPHPPTHRDENTIARPDAQHGNQHAIPHDQQFLQKFPFNKALIDMANNGLVSNFLGMHILLLEHRILD
jgi:hypothetical protein